MKKKVLKILLVDGEVKIAESHARLLRRAGHDVIEASRGDEAIIILNSWCFDLVISDYEVGQITGLDVLRAVKDKFPSCGKWLTLAGLPPEFNDSVMKFLGIQRAISKIDLVDHFVAAGLIERPPVK